MPFAPLDIRRIPKRTFTTQAHQAFNLPAPVGGLNYLDPITQQSPRDAIRLTNMVPRPYGVELRKGWRVWQNQLSGSAAVVSLMPYNPARGASGQYLGKLFAALDNGEVWDVTTQGAPTLATTVPNQLEPGEFSYINFATPAGNYLCAVSAGGGYWTYDSINGWVEVLTGTGPGKIEFPSGDTTTTAEFDFIMSWKNRLWFVKNFTTKAYYLPVNQITGTVSEFDFGPLFVSGGDLKMMASWTVDGGDGIDDRLVISGSEGDLLVYQGTDPDSADKFSLAGRWFVGPVPPGRRYMTEYGGDLQIVSAKGLTSMSELLQFAGSFKQYVMSAKKVNQVISANVELTSEAHFWEIKYWLREQLIIINQPNSLTITDQQFVMDVNSTGWAEFQGIPMNCCELFEGFLFFGTTDGRVGRAGDGLSDGVAIDGTGGATLEGELQTAWNAAGDSARVKRFIQVQPAFIASEAPSVKLQINVDWRFDPVSGSPGFVPEDIARWDLAKWDIAKWYGAQNSYIAWTGCQGIGRFASLRLAVRGAPGTIFTNWLLVAESGGIL
jgi:hypothetical protein